MQWPYAGANEFTVGEFNGDGRADLLVRRTSDQAAAVYLSTGDGSFVTSTSFGWKTGWPWSGADKIIATDFNGDGLTDILARRSSDNATTVYLSRGDGSFEGYHLSVGR